jgi:5-hydroxyisourate hydrolase
MAKIRARYRQKESFMAQSKGYLSTHVLDTSLGTPAEGLSVDLFRLSDGQRDHLRTLVTNSDGRTDEQILPATEFETGEYELVFAAGDYLARTAPDQAMPFFLSDIPIRFGISDPDAHYHVPLLLSPFGYSTYRGS